LPEATGSLRTGEMHTGPTEPRSVWFDVRSGMKTTVFSNGAQITEAFDIGSIRPLASPPPSGN
jgi:hypothetical protein